MHSSLGLKCLIYFFYFFLLGMPKSICRARGRRYVGIALHDYTRQFTIVARALDARGFSSSQMHDVWICILNLNIQKYKCKLIFVILSLFLLFCLFVVLSEKRCSIEKETMKARNRHLNQFNFTRTLKVCSDTNEWCYKILGKCGSVSLVSG